MGIFFFFLFFFHFSIWANEINHTSIFFFFVLGLIFSCDYTNNKQRKGKVKDI